MDSPDSVEGNQDIRCVLRQLIAPEGVGAFAADASALCDETVDAAARMRAFQLDHVHNEARLARVLAELAGPVRRDAA